jgi:DNA-binding transcriptional MerR regulator
MSKLLSPGEFAKLARTTKRTVLFYDEKEIIKPFKLDKSGYRWYKSSQIIDFQVILLLRKLNFSLEDIKAYLYKENSLKKLFRSQKEILKREIVSLQLSLKNITKYYRNLEATGTLVKPKIKKIKPLSIYYIYKEAAYADIKDICFELKNMFEFIPEGAKYLVIYMKNGYSPKKAAMKIGVIATEDMIIKKEYYSMIKMERIDAYKTLSYAFRFWSFVITALERIRKVF